MGRIRNAPGRTGGVLVYAVGGVTLLVALLVTALQWRGRGAGVLVYRARDQLAISALRQAIVTLIRATLEAQAKDPGSPLSTLLRRSSAGELQGRAVPLPSGWDRPLADLSSRPALRHEEEITLEDVQALSRDSWEKSGTLTARIRIRCNRRTVDSEISWSFAVLSSAAPGLSCFTLYVKNPAETGESSKGYNLISGDKEGNLSGNTRPLVLQHHGEDGGSTVASRGLVYLGTSDPGAKDSRLVLRLTAGHQWRLPAGQEFELVSRSRGQDAVPSFRKPLEGTGGIDLERIARGHFQGESTEGSSGSSDGKTDEAGSSVLHLFGSITDPSPTLIYGPVYRSFILESRLERQALEGSSVPTELSGDLSLGSGIRGVDPTSLGLTTSGWTNSQATIVEAYNRGLDSMANATDSLRAPAILPGSSYPDRGEATTLELPEGSALFQGDLGRLIEADLATRTCFWVRDGAEFKERFVKDGHLDLGRTVRVRSGDLDLPAGLTVDRGGMVVVPGDVTVRGIETSPGELLTLVSENGDLILETTRGSQEFFGVAPHGGVKLLGGSEIRLTGGLALDSLDPVVASRGGEIRYDSRYSSRIPSYRESHRPMIADREERWSL